MTRPEGLLDGFNEIVVVQEVIVGCAMRRDLLAAQKGKGKWKTAQAPMDAQPTWQLHETRNLLMNLSNVQDEQAMPLVRLRWRSPLGQGVKVVDSYIG